MMDYLSWHSFRELDEASGRAKGSAFRVFKQLEPQLQEARDYALLQLVERREAIEKLRSGQRIYRSSVNVVLLSPRTEALILKHLQQQVQQQQ